MQPANRLERGSLQQDTAKRSIQVHVCIASLLANHRYHQLSALPSCILAFLEAWRAEVFTNESTLTANRWRSFPGGPHIEAQASTHAVRAGASKIPGISSKSMVWCLFTHVCSRALTTMDLKHLSATGKA